VAHPTARVVEAGSLLVIALVVLFGGARLLVAASQFPAAAFLVLALLGILQVVALRRNRARRGPLASLTSARDIAFLAAILTAGAFVLGPARWSLGACVAALEFGLALELLARFVPQTSA